LLLVDEPDSHLHPDAQERLVGAIKDAAKVLKSQVIMTTHSPSVVRSLPDDANVVWMKNGQAQTGVDESDVRASMGWGILDKSIVIVTEDKKKGMLKNILRQDESIDRKTTIWSVGGSYMPQNTRVMTWMCG